MAEALEFMALNYNIDRHRCACYGFSRSATHCASYAFLDKRSGNNYFILFISTLGAIGPDLPMIRTLRAGTYGERPIEGAHFYLWCGMQDKRGRACEGMKAGSIAIIEELGGTVDLFRQGAEGHGGFNHNQRYQLEAVDLWRRIGGK